MRFDDSLKTVLSADMASGFGAQSAWRQLVDLIGRGRVAADEAAMTRLRMLRQGVPMPVRAASARALAFAQPPAALVGLFAEDELAIGAPVLRTAMLSADDWRILLPRLSPAGRSVLRHRRDLPADVIRDLESFGSTDFVLSHDAVAAPVAPDEAPAPVMTTVAAPAPDTPLSETPFVALGDVARGLPFVAAALREADVPAVARDIPPMAPPPRASAPAASAPRPADAPGFEIAALVARIDAFNRQRTPDFDPVPAPVAIVAEGFRFETDATGTIRWVEGVARGGLVGVSLASSMPQGLAQLDGVATGAFRRRSPFRDARLELGGVSEATGSWRIAARPAFDAASGRFTGFRGSGRRPRRDESASPRAARDTATSDSLRQLVHELRTPTNAVSGFAELIETQLLGPVPDPYRERAATIRTLAADLLAAIDDLDTAARIESGTLELRASRLPVLPMIGRVMDDLQPLADLRGARLMLDEDSAAVAIDGDDRAIERLVSRLATALVSAATPGERIGIAVAHEGASVTIRFDRPRALAGVVEGTMLRIDAEREQEAEGAPLLGTGFALRLAHNLAVELGGALTIGDRSLTLTLPAADTRRMGQATTR